MYNLKPKLLWLCIGAGITVSSNGFAASLGSLANLPLFLDSTDDPNIIMALDDSGSMDWETITDKRNGTYWVSSGKFSQNGSLIDYANNRKGYGYLFPNGTTSNYYSNNGQMLTSWLAAPIPPFRAYAFTRSSEYNRAYYDPSQTYEPWPIFGTGVSSPKGGTVTSLGNASLTAARFDPFISSPTLSLFQSFTPTGTGWGFRTESGMWCNDSGTKCTSYTDSSDHKIPYVPGTYYVVDSTSTYTYTETSDSGTFSESDSEIFEAEENIGTNGSEFRKGSDLALDEKIDSATFAELSVGASEGDFVGAAPDPQADPMNNPPAVSTGELEFNSKLSGFGTIWIRRWFPSGSDDSFWTNTDAVASAVYPSGNIDNFVWDSESGVFWNKWYEGHATSESWEWEKVADIWLTGNNYLKIRRREDGAYIDQVLITLKSGTPEGKLTYSDSLGSVTRSCATDTNANHYDEFFEDPSRFSGVDAISYDGRCLKKVDLSDDGEDLSHTSITIDENTTRSRTIAEERQNFANWFTYYRRRHHMMRGAIGKAFESINGARVGNIQINSRSDVTMYDLDTNTEAGTFLSNIYKAVSTGGTPLRQSLAYIGEQYGREDGNKPIISSCQRNFALMFTDGLNNGSISGIGNADGEKGSPFADEYENTLADIAQTYYETNYAEDITGIESNRLVPPAKCSFTVKGTQEECAGLEECITAADIKKLDCSDDPHMNSYMIGLGVRGILYDGQTYKSVSDAHDNPPTWPNVSATDTAVQVDDMYHAAVNGRGEMYAAQNSTELADALINAVSSILQESSSGSGVTFNTSSLTQESVVYTATFNPKIWSGELSAVELDGETGDIKRNEDGPITVWDAGQLLASKEVAENEDNGTASGERNIFTFNRGEHKMVQFSWDNLTQSQKDDLLSGGNESDPDDIALAKKRLEFIRGDMREDGKEFRDRSDKVLGDIINSTPVYVGRPPLSFPDNAPFGAAGDRYSGYVSSQTDRNPVVYIGANDGMLHGFEASSGEEIMGYIPDKVYSTSTGAGLHYLTDPLYAHKNYVDLTSIATDVYIDADDDGSKEWRTVLIGGLRGGGKGLFAIDVTDPSKFESANAEVYEDLALWEFTDSDDGSLGNITTPPLVAMVQIGSEYKWTAIFGNGYNASDDSTTLYLLFIDGGLDGTWTEGTDYIKITVPNSGTAGMSGASVVDLDNDRIADRAYAGDLGGNMWVFDLSGDKEESAYKQGSDAKPLFTAMRDGKVQPITAAPVMSRHPSENADEPNVVVVFGTGQYLIGSDPSNTARQSLYVVWDSGTAEMDVDDLVERQILTNTNGVNESEADFFNDTRSLVDPSTNGTESMEGRQKRLVRRLGNTDYEEMVLLTEDGERIIIRPIVRNDLFLVTSSIPSTEECAGGGSSWTMVFGIEDGSLPHNVIDINDDGKIGDDETSMGVHETAIKNPASILKDKGYNTDSDGEVTERLFDFGTGSAREGRLGWREIFDEGL